MKIASTLMAAATLALILPAEGALAQRGGRGGGGFHGGGGGGFHGGGGFGGGRGFRGGGFGNRGFGGYRGGYGYRGYGYGFGGFGLFGLGVLGGYALGSYPYGYDYGYGYGYAPDAVAPYAYDVNPEVYDSAPPPAASDYAAGDAARDANAPQGYDSGRQTSGADGDHCPLFWDRATGRYVARCS